MRKQLLAMAAIAAAGLMSTTAQAADFITISGPSGNFGDDNVLCSVGASGPCAFTRSFSFVTPAGFNLASIDISSIANANPATNIDFTSVTFNGVSFATLSTGISEFRNLLNQNLIAGGTNTINVAGTTGGNASFTGNVSMAAVAAVPEPAAWMLMLIGMAGVGYSMRRKEKPTLRVRYA